MENPVLTNSDEVKHCFYLNVLLCTFCAGKEIACKYCIRDQLLGLQKKVVIGPSCHFLPIVLIKW